MFVHDIIKITHYGPSYTPEQTFDFVATWFSGMLIVATGAGDTREDALRDMESNASGNR